jgi:hypothetical protein
MQSWLVLAALIHFAGLVDSSPFRAIEAGHHSGVRQLLKAGASPNEPDHIRCSALTHLGASVSMRAPIDAYAAVSACSPGTYTFLMWCPPWGLSPNANSKATANDRYTRAIRRRQNRYPNSLLILNSGGGIRSPVLTPDASPRISGISRWYNCRPQVEVPIPGYNPPMNVGLAVLRVARAACVPGSRA